MDKLAGRKFTKNRRLIATASVAMCMLCGTGGFTAQAAPEPQVVAASKATTTISGVVKDSHGNPIIGANVMEKGEAVSKLAQPLFFHNMLKNIKQSPYFHKRGLCHVRKFL